VSEPEPRYAPGSALHVHAGYPVARMAYGPPQQSLVYGWVVGDAGFEPTVERGSSAGHNPLRRTLLQLASARPALGAVGSRCLVRRSTTATRSPASWGDTRDRMTRARCNRSRGARARGAAPIRPTSPTRARSGITTRGGPTRAKRRRSPAPGSGGPSRPIPRCRKVGIGLLAERVAADDLAKDPRPIAEAIVEAVQIRHARRKG